MEMDRPGFPPGRKLNERLQVENSTTRDLYRARGPPPPVRFCEETTIEMSSFEQVKAAGALNRLVPVPDP
jgi:hypothetical protein